MKHLKGIVYVLMATFIFASCDNDDDPAPVSGLTFDKNAIEVLVGADIPVLVTVSNAEGELSVIGKEGRGSVEVAVSKEKGNIIEVLGKEAGVVLLTVKDGRGKTGLVKVTILDPVARFIWNESNKIEGVDGGTYTLTQNTNDGKVSFTWTSKEGEKSIVLTFIDASKKLVVGAKTDPTLTIDGKSISVASLSITNNVVAEGNQTPTIWIEFKAENKNGVCVAPLGVEPK